MKTVAQLKVIFTRDKTLDERELATCSKYASATLAGREVKPLAFYGTHEDLEGSSTEGIAVLEFPSIGLRRPGTTVRRIARLVSIV